MRAFGNRVRSSETSGFSRSPKNTLQVKRAPSHLARDGGQGQRAVDVASDVVARGQDASGAATRLIRAAAPAGPEPVPARVEGTAEKPHVLRTGTPCGTARAA